MASCNMNDDQSVELSIVIVVDGEEKQCSSSRPSSRPATPTSCCNRSAAPQCPQQQSCCSRPTTPQQCSQCCPKVSQSAHSCCSGGGGGGGNNKVVIPICVGKPVCQQAQPSSCQQQSSCRQQQSPCQQQQQSQSCCRQQQSPCQHSGCQQRQCQSQTAINPPRIIPTGNCCCASLLNMNMNTCQQHAPALPCRSKSQTTSCQTVGGVKCAPCASQTRTCTKTAECTTHVPAKKPCAKKKQPCPLKQTESRTEAKSAICQTQPEVKPKCPRRDAEEASESSRTSRRKERPRERKARERTEERRARERSEKSDETEMSKEERREAKREARRGERREEARREERREDRDREEPPKSRPKKSSLISPDQINFSQPPPVQMTFVDFFLQTTGGVTQVLNLAEAKHKYEKKCKSVLSKLSEEDRTRAEKFFMKIVESIQVKFPEGNTTDVKTFQINKYTATVMQDLGINADRELRHIQKYHNYVLGVVSVMEQRMRQREPMNPDAIIDVETALLAGIVARCYPLFMRMKDLLVNISKQGGSQDFPPQEFVKQLRKLILAIYVEILSIHVTFANALDNLSTCPNTETQERYRKIAIQRRGHARHSVTWAGRCIATVLLFDFLQTK